jgi:hypothetical protein
VCQRTYKHLKPQISLSLECGSQHLPAAALDKSTCLRLQNKLRVKAGPHSASGSQRILGIGLEWGMDRSRLPSMLIKLAQKL